MNRYCQASLLLIMLLFALGCQSPSFVDSHDLPDNRNSEVSEGDELPSSLTSDNAIDEVEKYSQLRSRIPYPGLAPHWFGDTMPFSISDTDEIGEQITYFLYYVGDPKKEVHSSTELENQYLLGQVLENAVFLYTTNENDRGSELYKPFLKPITEKVNDWQVALKEHVEAASKEIFGDNVVLTHENYDQWIWHEEEGVYTPPHAGKPMQGQPVIFDYEDMGDYYSVETVCFRSQLWWFEGSDEEYKKKLEEELDQASLIKPRYQIAIRKNENDTYSFMNCVYKTE